MSDDTKLRDGASAAAGGSSVAVSLGTDVQGDKWWVVCFRPRDKRSVGWIPQWATRDEAEAVGAAEGEYDRTEAYDYLVAHVTVERVVKTFGVAREARQPQRNGLVAWISIPEMTACVSTSKERASTRR